MQRDWSSEWAMLSDAERAAFKSLSAAYGELMSVFTRYGAPSMELLARVEAADKRWKLAKARCAAFIAEYRQAA